MTIYTIVVTEVDPQTIFEGQNGHRWMSKVFDSTTVNSRVTFTAKTEREVRRQAEEWVDNKLAERPPVPPKPLKAPYQYRYPSVNR